MNAKSHPGEALDDVLAQIADAPTPPDADTLRAWTGRFPQFAAEIIEFATDWVELDTVRSHEKVSAEDLDLVVNRTMSRVHPAQRKRWSGPGRRAETRARPRRSRRCDHGRGPQGSA